MEHKRVACLYRVSTLMQTEENDIPMQRNACIQFISTKPDWYFECEYLEKGVSGYKKSAADRDVLQNIKSDALKNRFDILLVFMFDRLGRREDETPFVVQWFVSKGVEVWSVNEGQQKFEGQADRLINYIRYWQSQGESEKTGIRVREKHTQMIKEGKRTGGVAPYGYKLIPTNETNHKGVLLHNMVIDDEESKVVKLIFRLATEQGFGGYRIAKELNNRGIPSRKGGQWGLAVVNYMFRNPIYKGYIAYSKTHYKGEGGRRNPDEWLVSTVKNPDWAIIEESVWDKAKEIRTSRTPKKFLTENIDYKGKHYPNQTKSNLLLIGMIHCGECGSSMSTAESVSTWKLKNGETHKSSKPVYKCNSKCEGMTCSGKHFYDKELIENTVLKQVYLYLNELGEMDLTDKNKLRHINDTKTEQSEIASAEKKIQSLKDKYKILKDEVVKSLCGESKFTPELLQNILSETATSILNKEKKVSEIKKILEAKEIEYNNMNEFQKKIPTWKKEFDNAKTEAKKMMLAELIDDVVVKKDSIQIKFRIDINSFTKAIRDSGAKIIEQSTTVKLS